MAQNMMAFLSVIVGAIVTGVFGNFLVQRWQLRSWREQQRQLGYQAELENLKTLVEEITCKAADRQNAMRRLVGSLAPNSRMSFEDSLTDYQLQLAIWNGSLNSIYVRLRMVVGYSYSIRFEDYVHDAFVEAGKGIEEVIRSRRSGTPANWHDLQTPSALLSHSKVATYNFLRDLTDIVEVRREEIYFGRKIFYRDRNLDEYSLFDLIKMTLSPSINEFYVVRSS